MRKLTSLMGNHQSLDGGAMFGNAPRALWSRWLHPDDENRIRLACRALLVEDEGRRILFETGIGSFFDPRLRKRYGVEEPDHVLLDSLAELGLSDGDIDLVVISHLHFDHAGGLLSPWREGESQHLLFPNARYLVGRGAWERACNPHPRDRASYIPGLTDLLQRSGRLELIEGEHSTTLGKGFRFIHSDGHSPGMLLTEIAMTEGPVVFAADLIPGTPWVHRPLSMGYDRFAEQLIDEKSALLDHLLACNGRLFYTHDPQTALSRLTVDEKGRVSATECLPHLRGLDA